MNHPAVRNFLSLWPAVFGSLLVFGSVLVEYWLMPVAKDFAVTRVERTDTPNGQVLLLYGTLRKVRDCKLLGVDAEGVTADGRIDLALKFKDVTNDDGQSRPVGAGEWGSWRVEIPLEPRVMAITLQSAHRCHPLWTSETKLLTMPARVIP